VKCPVNHTYREGLQPPPPRIAKLPVDPRGYPIPYFVGKNEGQFDFRFADPDKLRLCLKLRLCWTCGEPMGSKGTFCLGPMCTITRTAPEPPSHHDCALYSVKNCPFLSKPKMVRREDETTEANKQNVAGIMIERNPGVVALWLTKGYNIFPDPSGKLLIEVGEPISVTWWREGRPATRAEIQESIDSGIPLLRSICKSERDHKGLDESIESQKRYLPTE
jgi:hypothetical protein